MKPEVIILAFVSGVLAVALAVVAIRVSAREPLVCRCEVEVRPP